MEDEIEIVHMDLSGMPRDKLEAICNEAFSLMPFMEVVQIMADHGIALVPQVVDNRMN